MSFLRVGLRGCSLPRRFSSAAFAEAQERVQKLSEAPDNQAKLKLYALFKQGTVGAPNTSRPGLMDPVGRFKWDAWDAVKAMSEAEAQAAYVAFVDELVAADGGAANAEGEAATDSGDERILTARRGKIYEIALNRPEKFNALTREMYLAIQKGLEEAAQDSSTSFTVIKANGPYYSSGNDLGNFMVDMSDIARIAKESNDLLRGFVGALIDHPKPLIGLVQGPALGIMVTTLALFDVVYASDKATFHAPFSHLGQSPEGCSSFLFPRIMGAAKAGEFLLFGRKLSAAEALQSGLLTNVFPHDDFQRQTDELIQAYAKLPPQSMGLSKRLVRGATKEELHAVNARECDLLEERWQSAECANAIANFFSRKG